MELHLYCTVSAQLNKRALKVDYSVVNKFEAKFLIAGTVLSGMSLFITHNVGNIQALTDFFYVLYRAVITKIGLSMFVRYLFVITTLVQKIYT